MKLLLDTHILLWSLLEPGRLSGRVSSELENPHNELWLSPITTWEIMILSEKKRVRLDTDPQSWMREVLNAIPFTEAELNHEIAIQSRTVDLPHQDPADRFLVATAMVYQLTLVTADHRLLGTQSITTLPNK